MKLSKNDDRRQPSRLSALELRLVTHGQHRNEPAPGREVNGLTYLNVEVGPKLLELMHEVVPTLDLRDDKAARVLGSHCGGEIVERQCLALHCNVAIWIVGRGTARLCS
jgi:hypothetical protein